MVKSQKADGSISTNIGVNTVTAEKSVKELKAAVASLTSEWKSQDAQLKSNGQYMEAAKTRYDGLSKAAEQQKTVIAKLISEQKGIDNSTTAGAKAFYEYEKKINSARLKLTSLDNQTEKAKKTFDLYDRGIIEHNRNIESTSKSTNSLVARLRAEGKETEANRAKYSGLSKNLSEMTKLYDKQDNKLKEIARSSGKASKEYKEQEIRVNDLGKEMADTRHEMNDLDDSMKKAKPHSFQRIKESLMGTNKEGRKTHSLFKTIFSANIISSAFTSGISMIQSKIGELKDQGTEYVKYQQQMNASWLTLTGNAKEGKKMVDMTNDMAQAAANSTEMVDDLNQKLYSTTNSADKTKMLTKSILTLQDAFGKSDDAVKNFATQYSQMVANGKVQSQDMMSFVNTFPKIRQELLKTMKGVTGNTKMTMKDLNDMMSKGEVSSKYMDKTMENLSKKYSGATENFAKTLPGLERTIKARMPAIVGAFEKPFLEMKNPLLKSMGDWVSDANTEKKFTELGKAASKGVSTVMTAFSKVFKVKNGTKELDDIIDKLISHIGSFSKNIAKHAPDIVSNFKSVKNTLGDVFEIAKVFGGEVFSTVVDIVTDLGKSFGLISDKGGKAVSPLKQVESVTHSLTKHKDGIRALAKAMVALFAVKKASDFAGSVVKASDNITKFAKKTKKAGSDVASAVKWTAKISTKAASRALEGLKFAAGKAGKALKAIGGFMAANPFTIWIAAIAAVVAAFVLLYKHNKKFKKFVDGIVKQAKKLGKDVVKYVKQMAKDVKKRFGNLFGDAKSIFKNGFKYLKSVTKLFKDVFTGNWKDLGHDVKDIVKNLWKTWKSIFKAGFDYIDDLTGGKLSKFTKKISKTFKDVVGKTKDFMSDVRDKIRNGYNSVHNAFAKVGNGAIKGVNGLLAKVKQGLNWILDKVGASKIGSKAWQLGSIPYYRSGTGGHPKDGPALVNDSPFSHYREMFHLPTGETGFFPKQRNYLAYLPKGTEVLDGERSYKVSKLAGIPAYKNSKIGDFFSNIFDKGKDLLEDAESIIKHPIKFAEKVLANKIGKFTEGKGFVKDMAIAMPKWVANMAKDWIKQLFEDATEDGDFDGKIWHSGPDAANGVYAYLVKIAKQIIKKFPGMSISSGYRPGDQYFHGKRMAIDIAYPASMNGSSKYRAPANWAFSHFKNSLAYVIALNKIKDRKGWGGQGVTNSWKVFPEGGHLNHIHLNGALGPGYGGSGKSVKATGGHKNWMRLAGFKPSEYAAINYIVSRESGWNPRATNPGSGAYGLPQSLPGSKMASAGSDWRSNPVTQLRWMRKYVNSRYGGASAAQRFWSVHHWYKDGGWSLNEKIAHLSEGNKPEVILPITDQNKSIKLMYQALDYMSANDRTQTTQPKEIKSSKGIGKIEEKLDKIVTLLTLLLDKDVDLILNNQSLVKLTKAIDKQKIINKRKAGVVSFENI